MQRYFVSHDQLSQNVITIINDDAKHITKVMRMDIGDEIICSTPNGQVFLCSICELSPNEVHAQIVEEVLENRELPIDITIAQALPKGDKLEYVVQKGTELGAARFILFPSERSIVKWDRKKEDKKVERLNKIAKEAAEQSHRTLLPTIESVQSLEQLLLRDAFSKKIFAYEEKGKANEHLGLRTSFSNLQRGDSLLIVIGPEGGFSQNEVERLEEHGFIPCSLGPRILRTETAALYVLAAASYHFEL